MNILFTICGRAGSKGFKNKNLKTLMNCSLVYYTLAVIKMYQKQHAEHQIYSVINTDSDDLADLVSRQNKISVLTVNRAPDLAGDDAPKVSVIADCLSRAESAMNVTFQLVVDLDITSPLRTLDDVERAIDKKITRPDTDVVYSVTGSRRNPYFNMVKEENGFFVKAVSSDFTARQQAPVMYDMNASIYAYSPDALRTKPAKGFFNDKAYAVIMKDTAVLDIDSEEDFELMQVIAGHLLKTYPAFREVYEEARRF